MITLSLTHSSAMLSDFFFSWLILNVTSSVKLFSKLQKINSLLWPPKFLEPIAILDLIILSCKFLFASPSYTISYLRKPRFFPFCMPYKILVSHFAY